MSNAVSIMLKHMLRAMHGNDAMLGSTNGRTDGLTKKVLTVRDQLPVRNAHARVPRFVDLASIRRALRAAAAPECPKHPQQPAHNCGLCRSELIGAA